MWRSIHSLIGLTLSLLVMVLSVSGTVLATQPVYDRVMSDGGAGNLSVADMLRHVAAANPGIAGERLKRDASGQYKLTFAQNNRRQERFVDPATGAFLPERKEPALYTFMRDLHRSFTLGEGGRILSAIGAIAMALAATPVLVIAARLVQGAGAAALTPVSLAIALAEFPLSRRSTAIGGWAVIGGTSGVVAPTVGAVLVNGFGWRARKDKSHFG